MGCQAAVALLQLAGVDAVAASFCAPTAEFPVRECCMCSLIRAAQRRVTAWSSQRRPTAAAAPSFAGRHEPNPFAQDAPLVAPSDDPFAPSQPAAGGWAAEPGYLREQALLAAQQEADAHSPPSDSKHHWFGRSHSSSPQPAAAAAATQPGRARQRQPAGQQRAPAFGEGALAKWH